MEIKIAGPGCAKCKNLEDTVNEAVREAGIEARVTKVTDFTEIVKLGIMSTPGLIVNGKVKLSGKVPSKAEITQILASEADK